MTDPEMEGWEPGTAEELVADALALGVPKASRRMITDWTEQGMLGPPAFRKSTAHGSDARLYSAAQRRLFTEMLKARQRSPLSRVPHHTLIRPVLQIWLNFDTVVSDAQARRAWRTWARAQRSSKIRRSDLARAVVDRFAHPDAPWHARRKAQLLLEEGEKTRNFDWGKISSALLQVSSPWLTGTGQRIERGFGLPEFAFGVQEQVAMWMIRDKVNRLLAAEQVQESALVEARAYHRDSWPRYKTDRHRLRERAINPEMFAEPEDLEEQINEEVHAFVPVLGHTLGLVETTFAEAHVLASGRPSDKGTKPRRASREEEGPRTRGHQATR